MHSLRLGPFSTWTDLRFDCTKWVKQKCRVHRAIGSNCFLLQFSRRKGQKLFSIQGFLPKVIYL